MEKEVFLPIFIFGEKICATSYTAITVDTEAENIPDAIKSAEFVMIETRSFVHKKLENETHEITLIGKIKDNDNIVVQFVYIVPDARFKALVSQFKPANFNFLNDSNIAMVKAIADSFDPQVLVTEKVPDTPTKAKKSTKKK